MTSFCQWVLFWKSNLKTIEEAAMPDEPAYWNTAS